MSKNNRPDLPPLAQYKSVAEYIPRYGDMIVWAGWFSTWYGVVSDFDEKTGELVIIFAGLPYLLFTMDEQEQKKETRRVSLDKIQKSPHGVFAVHQHDYTRNVSIWFI